MTDQENKFTHELGIFHKEAREGVLLFYGHLSLDSSIHEKKENLNAINRTLLFWQTTMRALQTSFIIVLGRIFDQTSPHNLDRLLKVAQDNIGIFSRKALTRRNKEGIERPDDYLKTAYEPTAEDFRTLKKKVKKYRKIYKKNYRDIRNKVYAHNEVSSPEELQKLFSKTNIEELKELLVFLNAMFDALWELFHNGRKPVLKLQSPELQSPELQKRMEAEVDNLLEELTKNA